MSGPRWLIRIDTGGTFTDCVALDPSGAIHRAKVLSSSALRASVREVLDATSLTISEDWHAPSGLLRGFLFSRLGDPGEGIPVASYDQASGVIRLAAPCPGPLSAGDAFEVRSPEEAPVLAARLVTGTPSDQPLPPLEMRLATTRGTNALLERRGEPGVLFVTRGFRDLLRIGTQQRPDLFALRIQRPAPIFADVVEIEERLAADGNVLRPLDLGALTPELNRLLREGTRVAAIALMHSYRDPSHEYALRDHLLGAGFQHVSCSADLAPAIRLLPRAETAVVDAYLTPVLDDYLRGVRAAIGTATGTDGERRLHVMTSAGGLVRPDEFRAKDSLLSGPAGGVVGAARAGALSGFEKVITFDMGGTSTDVARFDGDHEYVWEHRVGDAHLLAPALAIESVAAGGGSVCIYDPRGLRVGPESAGAEPGPACYGAGGPLTITDVNLLLGRLDTSRFGIPVTGEPAEQRLRELSAAIESQTGETPHREAFLAGLLEIANERMADAIRGISLRKGYDPADYALVAFGGAGAQHGCAVADLLGMNHVVVPADAGLLSALGIGQAVVERFAERQVLQTIQIAGPRLDAWLQNLACQAVNAVVGEGLREDEVVVRRRIVNLRYFGQEATLAIEYEAGIDLHDAFEKRYHERYGHTPEARPVEVESLRVVASARPLEESVSPPASESPAAPVKVTRAWSGGAYREAPVYEREQLVAGSRFTGPALVWERHSATVVEDGWDGRMDGAGALVLSRLERSAEDGGEQRRFGASEPHGSDGARLPSGADGAGTPGETGDARRLADLDRDGDPAGFAGARQSADLDDLRDDSSLGNQENVEAVRQELFTHRFAAIVGEMGEMLRRTALSTNVKERLDFSCALLDPAGELVVNAPHIPVHLGALGLCVRAVREAIEMGPDDVIVTNHPAFGGSHLPDVTVITPVHDGSGVLLGYVANRAHHAEIGGTRPGSMPPSATSLAEEGVVIPPTHLVRGGQERWEMVRELLSTATYPSRAVEDNLADLRAQVAANHRGAQLLIALAIAEGGDVHRYMEALKSRAAGLAGAALARLPGGIYEAAERLDDGSPLVVRITISGDRAAIDFTGTAGVHPGNLNATPAIVRSVVLYVLRLLVDEPLPLNEGLMRAVDLTIPEGLLNPPFADDPAAAPAVVGGNTETSQRLTDTLLRALRLVAGGQGTMNNVLFGNDRFGYYETVCGGAGAGPGWAGESGVHVHMTNTRITDPEVVEHRYPVRVERFGIRADSGGRGRWPGGDGAVRELIFLEPMSLSVLTQHRVERPYGMDGGEPGARGAQRLVRASGEVVQLAPIDGAEVAEGDRLILETPGGGAWGAPSE
jgi:5-oxoprolinase (ATP-hydrolysing)